MPEPTGERWTAEQCAQYIGVKGARNYRSYVTRLGAPRPVGFNGDTGLKEYDADAVKAWHASRRGRGHSRPTTPPIDPNTNKPVVVCIDATCPSCGWAERNFDTGTQRFGCSQCDYTSAERNA